MIHKILCVVLAAGRSKRFASEHTKLIHQVLGRPMVINSLEIAQKLGLDACFVLGHEREVVESTILAYAKDFTKVCFCYQELQLGTAHALETSQEFWSDYEHILVINGDMPAIKAESIKEFCSDYLVSGCDLGFVLSQAPDPTGYGRVVKALNGFKIVEHKDASPEQLMVKNINAGIYIFKKEFLKIYISAVGNQNNSGEYYLTDLINLACDFNLPVFCTKMDYQETIGVNTVKDLAEIERQP